jgi:hypothetical protein
MSRIHPAKTPPPPTMPATPPPTLPASHAPRLRCTGRMPGRRRPRLRCIGWTSGRTTSPPSRNRGRRTPAKTRPHLAGITPVKTTLPLHCWPAKPLPVGQAPADPAADLRAARRRRRTTWILLRRPATREETPHQLPLTLPCASRGDCPCRSSEEIPRYLNQPLLTYVYIRLL